MISQISINNKLITNIKPIRHSFNNKNNKFSAIGFFKDKKVKIYEVFDKNQGHLMKFIAKNKELSKYFPELIAYNNKFIVEEWVNGITLKKTKSIFKKNIIQSEEIKYVIDTLWSLDYKVEVFDYLKFLYERIGAKCTLNLKNLPIKVNHNDLSLDNIILTEDGLKIIDNEFLGCNTGWIMNIHNSFIKVNFEYQKYISKDALEELYRIRAKWHKVYLKKFKTPKSGIRNIFSRFYKVK